MKYRDQEGDMVNVTTNEELRWAESPSGQMGLVKLYIVEVKLEQDPCCDHVRRQKQKQKLQTSSSCTDDWILEFSQLFKNYVGFNSDDYSNLYELRYEAIHRRDGRYDNKRRIARTVLVLRLLI
ncbi:hypothetical protein HanIR_Chr02g0068671 [Helianthus annuus]|nr:hypothetical protein HanIR_Chr02g0068671 [Helianthus annuus]